MVSRLGAMGANPMVLQNSQTSDDNHGHEPAPTAFRPEKQGDFNQDQQNHERGGTEGQKDEIAGKVGREVGKTDENEA
jgi:hypothetical protein